MASRNFVVFDNYNGVSYLKAAINVAWRKVAGVQHKITLRHIPLSLLKVVFKENNVDIKQAITDNNALYAKFNVSDILFKLNKETGKLVISKKQVI